MWNGKDSDMLLFSSAGVRAHNKIISGESSDLQSSFSYDIYIIVLQYLNIIKDIIYSCKF